jgi:VanZ family protein
MAHTVKTNLANPLRFEKTWQALGWIMVAIVIWLSLTPKPPQPPSFLGWDKAQHFAAYGCLMAWFSMSFTRHWRWPLFLISLGIALEFLQQMTGRSFDAMDMVANTIGVGIGLGLAQTPLGLALRLVDAKLSKLGSC